MSALQPLPLRTAAWLLRASKSFPGRWRLSNYAVRRVRELGPRMGRACVRTHYGYRMELRLDDWVDQYIYATGSYEDCTAQTMTALLRNPAGESGGLCVDIGANIGFFTLLMATHVGMSGEVWAFEPAPQTRERLNRNIAINRLAHITVRSEAAFDTTGNSLFFNGPSDHSGVASLRPIDSTSMPFEVRTCRLVDCVPPSAKVRLIKLDVEGAEHKALLGMAPLLQAQHPDLILELSDGFLKQMGSSAAEVHALLVQLGYTKMHRIGWDGLVACAGWHPSLPEQFNALYTVRAALPASAPVKR